MEEGSIIKAKVTGVKNYGAFVKCDEYDGLIHISEFSDDFVKNIGSIVQVGDMIDVKVLEVDDEHKRLKLSYKAANMIPKRVLKFAKIEKGFRSLDELLDEWIEKGYKNIKER